ncbi:MULTISPECIES: ABC transporter permease [Exiguobacterium]|uniref:ABC transporter n=1 Tax=Exiguobacterium chiriqhucha RW-2 TaxID=1345023 RepID=U1LZ18_9BACL|nr:MULTISPECIES: ABC transporter permease [Exiguobacterium]ERG67964.1 ABC transporter [Exiguobacterium chiriqhucha RW-2]KAB2863348.1 MAG: ABC transporter permease [Exiguobacterium chiriqhucha]TCI67246.1 ABC transporter permease [Exiguobacterium sp. IPCI3]TCI76704.1 ABC transporter permease [Exiguobacterium sp. IPCH1]TCI78355.1 ABC transporter permease [Exiguobacterium sp. IPBC4]
MFHNFGPLYSFTLRSKLRSKAFLISTLLTILFIFGFTNIDRLLANFEDTDQAQAILVTDNNELTTLMQSLGYEDIESSAISESEARAGLDNGDYEIVAFIEGDSARVLSERPEPDFTTVLQTALREVRNAELIEASNIDPTVLAALNEPVTVEESYLGRGGENSDELFSSFAFVYVMLMLLYVSIITYGSMISTEVTTEKSSRVMELIISTTHPVTHMLAKISAIGTLALLQIAIFLGFGYFSARSNEMAQSVIDNAGNVRAVVYLLTFFTLGYLLYAAMFAVLGSLVSRVEESQQMTMPVIMLLVAGFLAAMFGLNNPEAPIVTILSYVPFFTPMLMFLRVMLVDVPVWEVALSIGIMIATIGVILWVGSKFYRGGVLFYGNNAIKQWRQILQNRQ